MTQLEYRIYYNGKRRAQHMQNCFEWINKIRAQYAQSRFFLVSLGLCFVVVVGSIPSRDSASWEKRVWVEHFAVTQQLSFFIIEYNSQNCLRDESLFAVNSRTIEKTKKDIPLKIYPNTRNNSNFTDCFRLSYCCWQQLSKKCKQLK